MIQVTVNSEGDGWTCQVLVDQAGRQTGYTVRVSRAELERWGGGRPVEDLVRRSFEFLLEREPATSILRSFDLSVIQRYFPEFDQLFGRG